MRSETFANPTPTPAPTALAALARRPRDPRLDFFRGLGMCIILIAHIPWNPWTDWIPARFGFSDAADMFVFCSGMASALAFARVFELHGWAMGALRMGFRMWQIYWAHITSFLVVLTIAIAADQALHVDHYVREELNLQAVLDAPRDHLLGLMTLMFVPNYFDILPMYFVMLAMVPVVMALAKLHPRWVLVAMLACWLGAQAGVLMVSADHDTHRSWFFNPFAWQLIFFSGFGLVRGWLPRPPQTRPWIVAAILIVVAAIPFSCQYGFACYEGFGAFPLLGRIHMALDFWISKTNMGVLRYVHFMATAYLAWVAAGPRGARLTGPFVDIMRQIGQQTLSVFLTGMALAQLLGVALDLAGRTVVTVTLANVGGCALLWATSRLTHYVKSSPWSKVLPATAPLPQADAQVSVHRNEQAA